MVEFAMVAPILLLILFAIIQFGIVFMNSVALTDAVRIGARKASVSRTSADPTSATQAAILSAANDLDKSTLAGRISVTRAGRLDAGRQRHRDGHVSLLDQHPRHRRRLGRPPQRDDRAPRITDDDFPGEDHE